MAAIPLLIALIPSSVLGYAWWNLGSRIDRAPVPHIQLAEQYDQPNIEITNSTDRQLPQPVGNKSFYNNRGLDGIPRPNWKPFNNEPAPNVVTDQYAKQGKRRARQISGFGFDSSERNDSTIQNELTERSMHPIEGMFDKNRDAHMADIQRTKPQTRGQDSDRELRYAPSNDLYHQVQLPNKPRMLPEPPRVDRRGVSDALRSTSRMKPIAREMVNEKQPLNRQNHADRSQKSTNPKSQGRRLRREKQVARRDVHSDNYKGTNSVEPSMIGRVQRREASTALRDGVQDVGSASHRISTQQRAMRLGKGLSNRRMKQTAHNKNPARISQNSRAQRNDSSDVSLRHNDENTNNTNGSGRVTQTLKLGADKSVEVTRTAINGSSGYNSGARSKMPVKPDRGIVDHPRPTATASSEMGAIGRPSGKGRRLRTPLHADVTRLPTTMCIDVDGDPSRTNPKIVIGDRECTTKGRLAGASAEETHASQDKRVNINMRQSDAVAGRMITIPEDSNMNHSVVLPTRERNNTKTPAQHPRMPIGQYQTNARVAPTVRSRIN